VAPVVALALLPLLSAEVAELSDEAGGVADESPEEPEEPAVWAKHVEATKPLMIAMAIRGTRIGNPLLCSPRLRRNL
jgi:hypothetical protein